jgi:hypothetical protein
MVDSIREGNRTPTPTALFLSLIAETCDEVCVAEGFACYGTGKS